MTAEHSALHDALDIPSGSIQIDGNMLGSLAIALKLSTLDVMEIATY